MCIYSKNNNISADPYQLLFRIQIHITDKKFEFRKSFLLSIRIDGLNLHCMYHLRIRLIGSLWIWACICKKKYYDKMIEMHSIYLGKSHLLLSVFGSEEHEPGFCFSTPTKKAGFSKVGTGTAPDPRLRL